MLGLNDQARRISVLVILAVNVLTPLLAGSGNVFQVLASPVSYTLYGKTQGWGFTSDSISSPGPDLASATGETVSMTLYSADGVRHNFAIDYNGNGQPDPGEPISADFRSSTTPITYDFTATTTPGTYTYYCEFHAQQFGSFIVVVNNPPVLDPIGSRTVNEENLLTFTATATDPDPGQTLTFSLGAGAPVGASITSGGVFTWTPSENQGPSVFSVTVIVSDGSLMDSETIAATVDETNKAPVLAVPGDQSVNEGSLLTFPVSSSDPDIPANGLTLNSTGLPAWASFPAATGTGSATSTFSWTPASGQAGTYNVTFTATDNGTTPLSDTRIISIIVTSGGSTPPTLNPIGPLTVEEEAVLNFTATATDPDIGQTLTFSLGAGAPPGASIGPLTGVFTWTPTEDQGPNTYFVTVIVADNGSPPASDSETIVITVNEVNKAPVLAVPTAYTIDEETPLTFSASATDPDIPTQTLTFSLGPTIPVGASMAPDGLFSWTPTEAQGPASYSVSVVVSDGSLTDSTDVTIAVNETNKPPVLTVPGPQTAREGSLVTFTVDATDADLPINNMTYSASGLPPGATFDPATRIFSWTPGTGQAGTYTASFVATDDGDPPMSDTKTVEMTVMVEPAVRDCAIVSVDSAPSHIPPGVTVAVNVTVTNKGSVSESFNLTLSHDSKVIAVKRITSLSPGSGFTVTFEWSTAGLSPGNYTLTVSLDNLPGETYLTDNVASVTVNVIQPPSSSSLLYYPYLVGAIAAGIIGLLAYPFVGARRRGI